MMSLTTPVRTVQAEEIISEKKMGKLRDVISPVLLRYLKTNNQAQALIEDPSFIESFDVLVRTRSKQMGIFTVTVDYTRILDQMIAAAKFDKPSDSNISSEHFPFSGSRQANVKMIIVKFNHKISRPDALKEFAKLRLRAATLPELLALAEIHPEVQDYVGDVVALGSVWRSSICYSHVPYLSGANNNNYHSMHLSLSSCIWDAGQRFAAVRE